MTVTLRGREVITITTNTARGVKELTEIIGAPLIVLHAGVAETFTQLNASVNRDDPGWELHSLPASGSISWGISDSWS